MNEFLIDIILFGILLISVILGIWRGLILEIISLTGWIVAYIAARSFADVAVDLSPFDLSHWPSSAQYAIGFSIIFIITILLISLIANAMKSLMSSVGLKSTDRALGGIFGALRGILILLILAALVQSSQFQSEVWWQKSYSNGILNILLVQLKPLLPNEWHSIIK